jgi:hypothetical protein
MVSMPKDDCNACTFGYKGKPLGFNRFIDKYQEDCFPKMTQGFQESIELNISNISIVSK